MSKNEKKQQFLIKITIKQMEQMCLDPGSRSGPVFFLDPNPDHILTANTRFVCISISYLSPHFQGPALPLATPTTHDSHLQISSDIIVVKIRRNVQEAKPEECIVS